MAVSREHMYIIYNLIIVLYIVEACQSVTSLFLATTSPLSSCVHCPGEASNTADTLVPQLRIVLPTKERFDSPNLACSQQRDRRQAHHVDGIVPAITLMA